MISGDKWFCQRSRHCLPTRPSRCSAIADHLDGPFSATSRLTMSSSSCFHGRLTTVRALDDMMGRSTAGEQWTLLLLLLRPSGSRRRPPDLFLGRPLRPAYVRHVQRKQLRALEWLSLREPTPRWQVDCARQLKARAIGLCVRASLGQWCASERIGAASVTQRQRVGKLALRCQFAPFDRW